MRERGYDILPLTPWPVIRLFAKGRPAVRYKWTLSGLRMEIKDTDGWRTFIDDVYQDSGIKTNTLD